MAGTSRCGTDNTFDNLRRGVAADVREGACLSSYGLHKLVPDDPLHRPIPTLHEDRRANLPNELERRVVIEDHHRVHRTQREQQLPSFELREQRPVGALQAPDRRITVQADHEKIAESARSGEISGVSDVQ